MNIKKFTQKSLEAINGSEKFATDYGNQEITESHLLLSLLRQENLHVPLVTTAKRQSDARINVVAAISD